MARKNQKNNETKYYKESGTTVFNEGEVDSIINEAWRRISHLTQSQKEKVLTQLALYIKNK